MKKDDEPIIVEQTFDADIKAIWNAITKIDLMRQWYFDNIPDFRPEVGFETQFKISSHERDFNHRWKVSEAIPLRKIAYQWNYDAYPGDSFVEFVLFDEGESTELRLTVYVLEDFPEDVPEFRRKSCIAGWEYFIKLRLKEFLARIPES